MPHCPPLHVSRVARVEADADHDEDEDKALESGAHHATVSIERLRRRPGLQGKLNLL